MIRFFTILLLSGLFCTQLFSQEVVTGLMSNPVIKKQISGEISQQPDKDRDIITPRPIQLPFFDDFHQEGIFPDTARWTDREVFVNADFPFRSANVGAATFDAIDDKGNLYSNASTFPFIGDRLTSKPIRLDSIFSPAPKALTVSDSIYLSFYYQPQGRGNAPEEWDSLVLQFGTHSGDSVLAHVDSVTVAASNYLSGPNDTIYPLDTIFSPTYCDSNKYIIADRFYGFDDMITLPCRNVYTPEIEWFTAWSSKGMRLDTFYAKYNRYSRQVMIPITDSVRYFKKYFYFRFFNYASLATTNVPSWRSNVDQWNVDYIYLNAGRSPGDTTYRDICFVEKAPTVLKHYHSMPYSQYRNDPTNELRDSLRLYISNLYDEGFNTDYGYHVTEPDGPFTFYHDGGGCNLPPFYSFGYQKCDETCGASRACPEADFIYPLGFGEDSAVFQVRHIINGFTASDTIGDTITLSQEFYNYFAYDDGTPEAGYGINSQTGMVAYRFQLNQADTLRAIRMYFNRTENNANDQYFDLAVWRDNNGEPGELLYREYDLKPKFSSSLYQIQTYYLEEPVPINNVFYIGWMQFTDDNLNVGMDMYNDASDHLYYNVLGYWQKTSYSGALIMRPVIGGPFDPSGVPDNPDPVRTLSAFPNPSRDGHFHIRLNGAPDAKTASFTLHVSDLYGREVMNLPFRRTVDASGLPRGMYILLLRNNETSEAYTTKILLTH
ncbi:MAG: T9SS type A sorting domain-containing protein [Bacteroidales bacterium]